MSWKSVFVDGQIVNPKTGNKADLSVIGSEGNVILPYVENVVLKESHRSDTTFEVNFVVPYEKALELLSKDSEWFRLGNTMAIRWGYTDVPGAISPWIVGFMTMPEASFGEQITISVPVVSYGWNLDRTARTTIWSGPDNQRSFLDIAEEIGKFYGLKVEVGELTKAVETVLNQKRATYQQGGWSDLQFLSLTAKAHGARMVVRNDRMIFVNEPDGEPGKDAVTANFLMYGKIDTDNNVFPMDSFDPENMGTLFLQNMHGTAAWPFGPNDDPEADVEPVVVTGAKSDQNSHSAPETVNAPPAEEGAAPSAIKDDEGNAITAKANVVLDPAKGQAGRYIPIAMGDDFARQHVNETLEGARQDNDAESEGMIVNFECSIVPPWLLTGMFVRVDGVGDYYSCVYLLTEKETTISESGAKMSCVAGSRGFPHLNSQLDTLVEPAKRSTEPVTEDPEMSTVQSKEV
jgi:phage protein D